MVSGPHRLEVTGSELATTNNRMELLAAIGALKALNRACQVRLFTDSEYLRNGITKWIQGWKRNGWRTSQKEPVKNRDLWQLLALPWVTVLYPATGAAGAERLTAKSLADKTGGLPSLLPAA